MSGAVSMRAVNARWEHSIDAGRFLNGDGLGGRDDTDNMRRARRYAQQKGAKSIWIPTGAKPLVSAAIDLDGVSVFSPGGVTMTVAPSSVAADWLIGANVADSVMLYAKAKNNWSVQGLDFDLQDRRVKAVTIWGGDFCHIRYCHAVNSASAAFQHMGSRYSGDAPVRWSTIDTCSTNGSYWGVALDGEVISHLISPMLLNSVQNAISIDPHEAYTPSKRFARVKISNPFIDGRRVIPHDGGVNPITDWTLFWTDHHIGGAIATKTHVDGAFTYLNLNGAEILNWEGYRAGIDPTLSADAAETSQIALSSASGVVSGNYGRTDTAGGYVRTDNGLYIAAGSSSVLAAANEFAGVTNGVKIASDVVNSKIDLTSHRLQNVTNELAYTTLGAGTSIERGVGGNLSGAGAPGVVPQYRFQRYLDVTNSKFYEAKGTSSTADWVILN